MVTSGTTDSASLHELLAPYEPVRSIGSRPNPQYVARAIDPSGAKPQLLVAECFLGAATGAVETGGEFVKQARRIATLASGSVPRVREVSVRKNDVVVFGNFVDGEKLNEVWDGMPPEIALRVVIDVLSGLGALHNLRDLHLHPMRLAHGEVSPATILFGLDGTARLLHSIARQLPGAETEAASMAYLAPEVHAGEAYDASADVFGAGVLLWEALAGTRLFAGQDADAIVTRVRSGVGQATVRVSASWARGLVDVAAKALSMSPADRWPTAAAMAAEIRKAAGLHLAPAPEAGAYAKSLIGPRAKKRRDELECHPAEASSASEVEVFLPAPESDDVAAPKTNHEPESLTTAVEGRPNFQDVADLSPSAPVSEWAPVQMAPRAQKVGGHRRRLRGALLASASLLGVGALVLAGRGLSQRSAGLHPPPAGGEPAVASGDPLTAPMPSVSTELPVPSPSDTSAIASVSPPPPRAPARAHKTLGPLKPKAAAPSPHGKTLRPSPAHAVSVPPRTKPMPKPSGT